MVLERLGKMKSAIEPTEEFRFSDRVYLFIYNKGDSKQAFNVYAPAKPFYHVSNSLDILRDIAGKDKVATTTPISVPHFNPKYEKRYPLDVDFSTIRKDFPKLDEFWGITLMLDSPKDSWRYFSIGFGPHQPVAESSQPIAISYVSPQKNLPSYLSGVFHTFLPELPERDLSSAFAEFERELVSSG